MVTPSDSILVSVMKHNNIFRNTLKGLSILAAVCVVFTLSACSDDDDDDNDDTTSSDTASSDTTSSDTTSSDATYINGYAAVDLGLSVKWATCNVGADSPEDYGDYFAWGETVTKDDYSESTSATYGDIYITDDISGNAEYDAATANWGGSWRMPTFDEIRELVDSCTWTWTSLNDVNGYLVAGSNGNSIFLPATGYRVGTSFNYYTGSYGEYGYYWSSKPLCTSDSRYAYMLFIFSDRPNPNLSKRYFGMTIRPVAGE